MELQGRKAMVMVDRCIMCALKKTIYTLSSRRLTFFISLYKERHS